MPRFDFRCGTCGLEFEVSRRFGEDATAATCPVDGAAAERVFTMPTTFSRGRGQVIPPRPPSGGWGHHGHSHGPGVSSHSH